jgi:hypothetical protein
MLRVVEKEVLGNVLGAKRRGRHRRLDKNA